MEYTTPNALAKQYWKSLKTIYNRLQKYGDKIRTKKEFWKTIVNWKDFEKLFQNFNSNYKTVTNPPLQNQPTESISEPNPKIEKLQNDYNTSLQRIQNLEKHNSNLSSQINDYAQYLREEKNDKKEVQTKLESTTQKLTDKIEFFANEKIRLERKYYILFSFFAITGVMIIRLQLPEILKFLPQIIGK